MFPVECFDVGDPNKIEAVKYYLELNKKLLKQFSAKESAFLEFLKTEGKDVLKQMAQTTSNTELYELLARIECELPYADKLQQYQTIEQKVQCLHKELAKHQYREERESLDRKTSLKIQRGLDKEYDELQALIVKYRDAVANLNYIKRVGMDDEALTALYSKNTTVSKEQFVENFKLTVEGIKQEVKELRQQVFEKMRDYHVKEMVNFLEHEALAGRY